MAILIRMQNFDLLSETGNMAFDETKNGGAAMLNVTRWYRA